MATAVRVNTLTYTTTYIAGNMLKSLKQLIVGCGLDPNQIVEEYAVLERGIKTWLDTGDLRAVTLEVYNTRTNAFVGRFDFGVDYGYGSDDTGAFWLDTDEVAFAIHKAGLSASGCSYSILADAAPGRPDVEGWSRGTYRSTDGFSRHAVGTAIGAGTIGVGIAYYRKTS